MAIMKRGPHVLVVAGSDSSGGAGIVRDIETLAAFGAKACVAITAVTVQTHHAVQHADAVPADRVTEQMRAALAANRVDAIKIGLLATPATIAAVASVLGDWPDIPVVLDPVLAATSGGKLLAGDATAPLNMLFHRCTLITPNVPELAHLAARHGAGPEEGALDQAQRLIEAGARAILVKGGHGTGEVSVDILVLADRAAQRFEAPRLAAAMRGTGCMLASAIAARLAFGDELSTAIRHAKAFTHDRIAASTRCSVEDRSWSKASGGTTST